MKRFLTAVLLLVVVLIFTSSPVLARGNNHLGELFKVYVAMEILDSVFNNYDNYYCRPKPVRHIQHHNRNHQRNKGVYNYEKGYQQGHADGRKTGQYEGRSERHNRHRKY